MVAKCDSHLVYACPQERDTLAGDGSLECANPNSGSVRLTYFTRPGQQAKISDRFIFRETVNCMRIQVGLV